jgi:hypothetical protein
MKEKDNIKQELEEWSPLLAQMRKEIKPPAGQAVPEGYFDSLADQVLEKVKAEETSPLRVVHTGRRSDRAVWYRGAAAVALIAVAIGGLWYSGQEEASIPSVSLADVGQREAAAYVNSNIGDFELSLLKEAALLNETTDENAEIIPQLNEVPVEDYLDDLEYEDIEAFF